MRGDRKAYTERFFHRPYRYIIEERGASYGHTSAYLAPQHLSNGHNGPPSPMDLHQIRFTISCKLMNIGILMYLVFVTFFIVCNGCHNEKNLYELMFRRCEILHYNLDYHNFPYGP